VEVATGLRCSLCGELGDHVVTSPRAVACAECVGLCLEVFEDARAPGPAEDDAAADLSCGMCRARGADRYFAGMDDVHVCGSCVREAGRLLKVSASDGPIVRVTNEPDEFANEVSSLMTKLPPEKRNPDR